MASLGRRPTPQSPKRAAIEASVLRATEELLTEGSSFAELNIERIATRAGISRTAFYFYFHDKRELLMRLTEDIATLLYAAAERWWRGEGDGAAEMRTALEQIVVLYRDHGALLRAVVEVATYDEMVAGFWRAVLGRFVIATRERIASEQAAGRASGLPAEETAFALCWMTERTCYEHLAQPGEHADEAIVAALVAIWIRTVYGAPE